MLLPPGHDVFSLLKMSASLLEGGLSTTAWLHTLSSFSMPVVFGPCPLNVVAGSDSFFPWQPRQTHVSTSDYPGTSPVNLSRVLAMRTIPICSFPWVSSAQHLGEREEGAPVSRSRVLLREGAA